MALIRTISKFRAGGETAKAYKSVSKLMKGMKIPNIVKVFSLRPASMCRMMRKSELAMYVGDEPRSTRELMGVLISHYNRCHY